MNVGTLTANPILPWWNWTASPRRAVDLCFGVADRGTEADINGAHLQRALTANPHSIWDRTTSPGKPPAVSLCFWIAIVFRVCHIGASWHVFLKVVGQIWRFNICPVHPGAVQGGGIKLWTSSQNNSSRGLVVMVEQTEDCEANPIEKQHLFSYASSSTLHPRQ